MFKSEYSNIRGRRWEHLDIKTQVIQYTQCDRISLNETWLKDDTETISTYRDTHSSDIIVNPSIE